MVYWALQLVILCDFEVLSIIDDPGYDVRSLQLDITQVINIDNEENKV